MQVVSLLPNAVHIKDSEHVWIEVNDSFAEIMGYTREELIGKTSFDVMPRHEAEIACLQDKTAMLSSSKTTKVKRAGSKRKNVTSNPRLAMSMSSAF